MSFWICADPRYVRWRWGPQMLELPGWVERECLVKRWLALASTDMSDCLTDQGCLCGPLHRLLPGKTAAHFKSAAVGTLQVGAASAPCGAHCLSWLCALLYLTCSLLRDRAVQSHGTGCCRHEHLQNLSQTNLASCQHVPFLPLAGPPAPYSTARPARACR